MTIDAIIQARMDSSRLRGKVLMKLNSETSLECLINQLGYSKFLNCKVIATSTNKEDDDIYNLAKTKGYEIFRGSNLDVLDRFYQCAKKYKMKTIVRITADDPLIDPQIVDEVIQIFEEGNFDYVSNCQIRTFPFGTETEVFTFGALEKAWNDTKTAFEREHVTTYFVNHPEIFTQKCVKLNENLSHLRWTVDKKQDFEFVKLLYKKLNKHPFLLKDILKIIQNDPEILEINKKVAREYQNQ